MSEYWNFLSELEYITGQLTENEKIIILQLKKNNQYVYFTLVNTYDGDILYYSYQSKILTNTELTDLINSKKGKKGSPWSAKKSSFIDGSFFSDMDILISKSELDKEPINYDLFVKNHLINQYTKESKSKDDASQVIANNEDNEVKNTIEENKDKKNEKKAIENAQLEAGAQPVITEAAPKPSKDPNVNVINVAAKIPEEPYKKIKEKIDETTELLLTPEEKKIITEHKINKRSQSQIERFERARLAAETATRIEGEQENIKQDVEGIKQTIQTNIESANKQFENLDNKIVAFDKRTEKFLTGLDDIRLALQKTSKPTDIVKLKTNGNNLSVYALNLLTNGEVDENKILEVQNLKNEISDLIDNGASEGEIRTKVKELIRKSTKEYLKKHVGSAYSTKELIKKFKKIKVKK